MNNLSLNEIKILKHQFSSKLKAPKKENLPLKSEIKKEKKIETIKQKTVKKQRKRDSYSKGEYKKLISLENSIFVIDDLIPYLDSSDLIIKRKATK